MAEITGITEKIAQTARDAAYVAVGLGVIGFQKAQVRRHELAGRIGASNDAARDAEGDRSARVQRRTGLYHSVGVGRASSPDMATAHP